MSKHLKDYASSSKLMNVRIKYGEELFKFNLFEELVINENKISSEIKDQPGVYGFLLLLHKKLVRISKDLEVEVDKKYAELYVSFKRETNPETNKPYADEFSKQMALEDKDYNDMKKKYNEAEEKANIIYSCVKSLEVRKDMIQTLSANLRQEK